MRIAIYIIWFLVPTFFFVMALWGLLETWSNRHKQENPADFFKQGIFVLVCVLVCVLIDRTVLPQFTEALAPDYLTLGFWQVVLFPIVLVVASKIVGGSNPVLIGKAPHPSEEKKASKPKRRK